MADRNEPPATPAGADRIAGRCPRCGQPRSRTWRPFCSRGCRDRDLLAWLDGRYAIPVVDDEDTPAPGEGEPGTR